MIWRRFKPEPTTDELRKKAAEALELYLRACGLSENEIRKRMSQFRNKVI